MLQKGMEVRGNSFEGLAKGMMGDILTFLMHPTFFLLKQIPRE